MLSASPTTEGGYSLGTTRFDPSPALHVRMQRERACQQPLHRDLPSVFRTLIIGLLPECPDPVFRSISSVSTSGIAGVTYAEGDHVTIRSACGA
jgi:hypothetical protein